MSTISSVNVPHQAATGSGFRWLRLVPLAALLCANLALARASLEIAPPVAKPGDPLVVTVLGAGEVPEGTAGGRPLHFYPVPGGFQALTGLPVETAPGRLPVRVQAARKAAAILGARAEARPEELPAARPWAIEGEVEVVEPKFRSSELRVAKQFIEPPASVQKQLAEDRAAFARALSQPFGPPAFRADFQWPRRSGLTAPFGDLRLFNGKKQSQHYGLDLDGRVGDPIEASNDGTVVMVRSCYSSGNTVILDHGGGLYTLYFHLSHFEVKEGQKVARGQLLGLVGGTGRVTGPHLHFSVKVDGLYVDGATILGLPFAQLLRGADARPAGAP